MKNIINNIHIITCCSLFLSLKLLYTQTTSNDLIFLLYPTDQLVCIFKGSHSNYIPNSGYFHSNLNILIEKSCAGFNFLILFFLISYITCLQHIKSSNERWYLLPICFVISYLLTIIANASRIIISILFKLKFTFLDNSSLHQLQGTFIYLFFLLFFYLILKHYLNKQVLKNEKFA